MSESNKMTPDQLRRKAISQMSSKPKTPETPETPNTRSNSTPKDPQESPTPDTSTPEQTTGSTSSTTSPASPDAPVEQTEPSDQSDQSEQQAKARAVVPESPQTPSRPSPPTTTPTADAVEEPAVESTPSSDTAPAAPATPVTPTPESEQDHLTRLQQLQKNAEAEVREIQEREREDRQAKREARRKAAKEAGTGERRPGLDTEPDSYVRRRDFEFPHDEHSWWWDRLSKRTLSQALSYITGLPGFRLVTQWPRPAYDLMLKCLDEAYGDSRDEIIEDTVTQLAVMGRDPSTVDPWPYVRIAACLTVMRALSMFLAEASDKLADQAHEAVVPSREIVETPSATASPEE